MLTKQNHYKTGEAGTTTGFNINSGVGIWDETANYIAGDTVFWDIGTFTANTTITGGTAGDLSNSPDSSTDWDKTSNPIFSAYPTSDEAFSDTRINVTFATERVSSEIAHLNAGEIILDSSGDFFISVTSSNTEPSGSNRSGSRTFLQLDTGSGFADVTAFQISQYHRGYSNGEDTGNQIVLLSLNKNDKLRVQTVRYIGSGLLSTIADGYSINIWSPSFGVKGSKGDKGDKGDAGADGADGDMVWRGPWSAGTYNENDVVERNGSSYVCTQNGNTNTPPGTGWDLLVEKGTDGSGTSLNIQDDSVTLPNTPHSTLNFKGIIGATDAGSGVADIEITKPSLVLFGMTGTQTVTTAAQDLLLDATIKADTNAFTLVTTTGVITAQRAINVKVSYNVFMTLDSGDTARNTVRAKIQKNNLDVNYTQSAAYSRGYAYDPHANCSIPATYITLAQNDTLKIVIDRDDDVQSPVVGSSQTWITIEEVL